MSRYIWIYAVCKFNCFVSFRFFSALRVKQGTLPNSFTCKKLLALARPLTKNLISYVTSLNLDLAANQSM